MLVCITARFAFFSLLISFVSPILQAIPEGRAVSAQSSWEMDIDNFFLLNFSYLTWQRENIADIFFQFCFQGSIYNAHVYFRVKNRQRSGKWV